MLQIGQPALITGFSLDHDGQTVTVKEAFLCDAGERTVILYKVSPDVLKEGVEVLFQRRHLMPLTVDEDEISVLQLDLRVPVTHQQRMETAW